MVPWVVEVGGGSVGVGSGVVVVGGVGSGVVGAGLPALEPEGSDGVVGAGDDGAGLDVVGAGEVEGAGDVDGAVEGAGERRDGRRVGEGERR